MITFTNKGLRPKNEDYLLSKQFDDEISFHIIADGMGGYSFGDVAAKMVVETIATQVEQLDFSAIADDDFITICKQTTKKLQDEGIKLSSKLGATFAAVLIVKDTIYIFWMGDSRIYLFDENKQLLFQSTDHSLINELRISRKLTLNEIKKYDAVVMRCLSSDFLEFPPQIETLSYSSKNTIILCSDGLHKEIDINEMVMMDSVKTLPFLLSIENEMSDNYSVIIV